MQINKGNEFTDQAPIPSGFGPLTTAKEALGNRELKGKVAVVTEGIPLGFYSFLGNY